MITRNVHGRIRSMAHFLHRWCTTDQSCLYCLQPFHLQNYRCFLLLKELIYTFWRSSNGRQNFIRSHDIPLNHHSSLLACHADWFNQVNTFLLPLTSLCCFVAVQVKDLEDEQHECVFVTLTATLQKLLCGQVSAGQIPVFRSKLCFNHSNSKCQARLWVSEFHALLKEAWVCAD